MRLFGGRPFSRVAVALPCSAVGELKVPPTGAPWFFRARPVGHARSGALCLRLFGGRPFSGVAVALPYSAVGEIKAPSTLSRVVGSRGKAPVAHRSERNTPSKSGGTLFTQPASCSKPRCRHSGLSSVGIIWEPTRGCLQLGACLPCPLALPFAGSRQLGG